jgi:predicted anti-sigma-YlaC factor YlaD
VTRCSEDIAVLISLRAVGGLTDAESARVEAHLATCERCRAEADADAEVLALARLPPASEAEQRAAAVRPTRALAAFRGRVARRARWVRYSAVLAVAAAAVLAILAPAYLRRPHGPRQPTAAQVATWEAPDLQTLWDDTSVLDLDGTSSSDAADVTDAALAAADL